MGCALSSDSTYSKQIVNKTCGKCFIGLFKIVVKKVMLESLKQNLEFKNHLSFKIRIGNMIEQRTIDQMFQNPQLRSFSFLANKCCVVYGRALTLEISNSQTNNLAIGTYDMEELIQKPNKWARKKVSINYGRRQAGFVEIQLKYVRLPYTKYALSIGYTTLRNPLELEDSSQKLYAKIKLGQQQIFVDPHTQVTIKKQKNQVQQIFQINSPFDNPQMMKVSIIKTLKKKKQQVIGQIQFNIEEQYPKLLLKNDKKKYSTLLLFLHKEEQIVGEIVLYLKKISEEDTEYFKIPDEVIQSQTTIQQSLNFSSVYSMNQINCYVSNQPEFPGDVSDGFLCYSGRTEFKGKSMPASQILTTLKMIDPKKKKPRKLNDN